jgi:hypothetical protein
LRFIIRSALRFLGCVLPNAETATKLQQGRRPLSAKGILSLSATVVLCLPSLLGGIVLLGNVVMGRDMGQWEQTSSALVAFGLLLGGPMVTFALILGGVTSLDQKVPALIKYAQLILVALSVIATLSLLSIFGKF